MIGSYPRPPFAVSLFDETNNKFRARPHADVVRWVAPAVPAAINVESNDEWRPYIRALNPAELTGCLMWLDPDDLAAGNTADTALAEWPARIGPSPTISNAPTYRAAAGPNSIRDAIEFDGSTDYLTIPQTTGGLQATAWIEYTIVAVAQSDYTSTAAKILLSNDLTGYNGDLQLGLNPTNGPSQSFTAMFHDTVGSTVGVNTSYVNSSNAIDTSWHQWINRFRRSEGLFELWEDGAAIDTTPSASITTNYFIGRNSRAWEIGRTPNGPGSYWDGKLSEFIIFDRKLSDAEMTALISYLDTKHGT